MNRTLTATALLLGWTLAGSTLMTPTAAGAADGTIEEQIGAAKTAADHEAIAAQYDKMAAEAKERTELHQRMRDAYRKVPTVGPRGANTHFAALTSHCSTLSTSLAAEAVQYEALAKEHRAIAKTIH